MLTLPPFLWAQGSAPHVAYVYPAGGQQGTKFEIKLGGQFFNQASEVQVSGTGVTAKVLRQTRPMTGAEIAALRMELEDLTEELKKKPGLAKELTKQMDVIREKLAKAAIPVSPVLAENVFVEVVIASGAPVGPRELRLQAKTGMSNPVVFDVGQLPEFRQFKESYDPEARPRPALARFVKPKKYVRESEVTVSLPAVLNSQLMPGQVDHYRFHAKKGQHLVFRTRARSLIPYLADAVPGWIQSVLTLYDDAGEEVAFNDDYANGPDAVLDYKVPRDGEYVLEINDSLYRGREDFVYRIEAGELPHITNVFPLGGQANVKSEVSLSGWNLPQSTLVIEAKDKKPGMMQLSVQVGGLRSNQIPFMVTPMPSCNETDPHDSVANAQKIPAFQVVEGRIARPGELDVYCFEGSFGQTIVAEVIARRLGSPLDSFLKLTDADGKILAFNDDFEQRSQGLMTHHADSKIQLTLSKAGTYYLLVGDIQGHGSPIHSYRLRISPPRPDYELRVTPCSINARPGSLVPVTIYALRKDGFSGEINLTFNKAPREFGLEGAKIPENQNEVRITIQVPDSPQLRPIPLEIEGRASIRGEVVRRIAVPAEDMMQAFAYHHLVPANQLLVLVSNNAAARFPARLVQTRPIKIRAGGTATVNFATPGNNDGRKLQVFLSDPPEGISLKRATFAANTVTLELQADSEKAKPGLKTNLIAQVFPDSGNAGKPSRFPLGTLPAFQIEVLGRPPKR
jgi:hypothetical protein